MPVGGSQVVSSRTYGASAKRKRSRTPAPRVPRATKRQKFTTNSYSGYVPASRTTLARAPGPFKNKKMVTFEYQNELTVMGGATNLTIMSTMPNSLYDYDKHGIFGNKQPLFYDALLSASGPYKQYKVISWTTTYTILNTSTTVPITCWAIPPVPAQAEIDSAAEADNFPGVERLYLTGGSGSKNMGTLTVSGHIADVYPGYVDDNNIVGNYNSDPSLTIYGGLIVKGADGSTAPSVYVAVKHMTYCELSFVDALVS